MPDMYLERRTLLNVPGPDDRIRTCGPMPPKHVLHQTEPHPDVGGPSGTRTQDSPVMSREV